MTFTASKLLQLIAVICFVLAFFGVAVFGDRSLVALGLAFLASSFLV